MSGSEEKIKSEKELVLFRLLASDPRLQLSVGGDGTVKTYTREQIIEHVKTLDEVGKEYIKTQMEFMRAMGSGELYFLLNETAA